MKRYKALMLALAAFASILLLTAAAAVLLGSGGWQGAKNAAYPYTWKETTDGALALRLDVGARSDAAWSVADGSGMTSVSFGDTRRGTTSATLTPLGDGREELRFLLRAGDETLAETLLTVETSGGALRIASHRQRVMQTAASGGERGCPFTLCSDGDGGLLLHIEDAASELGRWSASDDGANAAEVILAAEEETGVTFLLLPVEDGDAVVTVCSEAADVSFAFSLTVREDSVLLTDYSETAYEAPQTPPPTLPDAAPTVSVDALVEEPEEEQFKDEEEAP